MGGDVLEDGMSESCLAFDTDADSDTDSDSDTETDISPDSSVHAGMVWRLTGQNAILNRHSKISVKQGGSILADQTGFECTRQFHY
jgi:hypothetical protein